MFVLLNHDNKVMEWDRELNLFMDGKGNFTVFEKVPAQSGIKVLGEMIEVSIASALGMIQIVSLESYLQNHHK